MAGSDSSICCRAGSNGRRAKVGSLGNLQSRRVDVGERLSSDGCGVCVATAWRTLAQGWGQTPLRSRAMASRYEGTRRKLDDVVLATACGCQSKRELKLPVMTKIQTCFWCAWVSPADHAPPPLKPRDARQRRSPIPWHSKDLACVDRRQAQVFAVQLGLVGDLSDEFGNLRLPLARSKLSPSGKGRQLDLVSRQVVGPLHAVG